MRVRVCTEIYEHTLLSRRKLYSTFFRVYASPCIGHGGGGGVAYLRPRAGQITLNTFGTFAGVVAAHGVYLGPAINVTEAHARARAPRAIKCVLRFKRKYLGVNNMLT